MAVRRLTEITAPATISEVAPLDLDLFNLQAGDDISLLLTDIVTRYGSVYVRAPSKSVQVVCDTISFSVANFVFLEDESATNKLTIQHAPSGGDSATISVPIFGTRYKKPIMWLFANPTSIKIGGTNLSVTFIGTHRGLHQPHDYFTPPYTSGPQGNYNDPTGYGEINSGLIQVMLSTSASPDLFDFRANVRLTLAYAIYTFNASPTQAFGGDSYRIKQMNVAGLFWATAGVFPHQGVKSLWYDPDRTVFSDPYLRCGFGWDGTVVSTDGIRKVGNSAQWVNGEAWFRVTAGHGMYIDKIEGGITIEYGFYAFVPRYVGNIGTAASPFKIRVKDWGVSGPGTAYQSGVSCPAPIQLILFKGDPAPPYGNTTPLRFIEFIKVPSTYYDGAYRADWLGDNLVRVEANDFNGIENFGYDVKFSGNWNVNFARGQLFLFEYSSDPACRTWGHVLRAPSGTTITDQIVMNDTDTIAGPGTFANISTATAVNSTTRDNTIRDCRISGAITIGASTGTTTVRNVQFTGAARAVMTIAAGTTVYASALTAPLGSTITGTGALYYSTTAGQVGTVRTLPFAVPTGDANVVANGVPNSPTGGSVS